MNASRASELNFALCSLSTRADLSQASTVTRRVGNMIRSLEPYAVRQARANTPSTRHVHAKYTAAMPLEAAPPLAAAHSISLACISMQEPFGLLLRR